MNKLMSRRFGAAWLLGLVLVWGRVAQGYCWSGGAFHAPPTGNKRLFVYSKDGRTLLPDLGLGREDHLEGFHLYFGPDPNYQGRLYVKAGTSDVYLRRRKAPSFTA